MGDLRPYMNGRSLFPPIPPPPDLLSGHRTLTPAHHYEMVMGVGRHPHDMINPGGGVGGPGGGLHHHHHHHHHQLELIRSDSNTNSTTTASAATTATTIPCGGAGGGGSGLCGGGGAIGIGFMSGTLEMEGGGLGVGDGGNGRWPRQETLTLLEIRSRLDPKFKEANQKGPLWDEVSR